MFSSTLFFLSVFAYVGLAFGYQAYLNGQADRLDREAKTIAQQVTAEDQQDLIAFYSQLANLESILDSHVLATNAFSFLERSTHPNVYFTKFDLAAPAGKATLAAVAATVKDVTEQIQIFEQQTEVKSVSFSNVNSLATGGWQFDISLELQPEVLTEIEQAALAADLPATSTATTTPVSAP